jgi:hypothetical protein
MTSLSVRFGVRSRKLSNVGRSLVITKNLLSRAPQCFGRHVKPLVPAALKSLAPTNPHWARVVGYGSFSLCVFHKEGLCPSSGDINRLMMKGISWEKFPIAGISTFCNENNDERRTHSMVRFYY